MGHSKFAWADHPVQTKCVLIRFPVFPERHFSERELPPLRVLT